MDPLQHDRIAIEDYVESHDPEDFGNTSDDEEDQRDEQSQNERRSVAYFSTPCRVFQAIQKLLSILRLWGRLKTMHERP